MDNNVGNSINLRMKPRFLPQISAPYTEVLSALENEGIGYENINIDPNELNVLQGITFSHNIDNVDLDDDNPIWISKNNDVCDGHHRMGSGLFNERNVNAIRVDLDHKDTCRVLNKIQDIYEYSQQEKMEEIVGNDILNNMNDNNYIEDEDFLTMVDHHVEESEDSKNPAKIIAYRKTPISETSVIGNFFILEPAKGYKKYEIEFENLLETDHMGISYKDGQLPIEVLSKSWFPHVNFITLGEKHGVDDAKIRNRAIVEKAKKMGYDGILYGNKLVQGF